MYFKLLIFHALVTLLFVHAEAYHSDYLQTAETADYLPYEGYGRSLDGDYLDPYSSNDDAIDYSEDSTDTLTTADDQYGEEYSDGKTTEDIYGETKSDPKPFWRRHSSRRRVCSTRRPLIRINVRRFIRKIFPKKGKSHCVNPTPPCKMAIPDPDEASHCKQLRQMSIMANRQFFKLTRFGEKQTIAFPEPQIPFLNATRKSAGFYAALDPVDSRWLVLLGTFRKIAEQLPPIEIKNMPNASFTTPAEYIKAYQIHAMFIKQMPKIAESYFSNPTLYPTFTDFLTRFSSDDIFVQQRFAGACPFLIKLVTVDGHAGFKWCTIKGMLNNEFDFDAAISSALNEPGVTLDGAAESGRLYVVYHPENNDMSTIPDYFDVKDQHYLEMTSPIALFARTASGDLKVFAIQLDYKNSAPVYTPQSSAFHWNLAKAMVNLVDKNICQGIWHLDHIHFSSGVYCAIYRSHFSKLHPIYQIMRHHCQGTAPHIAMTYGELSDPGLSAHKVFGIGHSGFMNLTRYGNTVYKYETLDLEHLLSSMGLNNNLLKYHPFRDDGKEIYNELKRFANEFVRTYYLCDEAVAQDQELQGFALQISKDGGKGDLYGGKGNIVNFPPSMSHRRQVATFVTRFIWQIMIHHSIMYPLEPYGTFLPFSPSKLYKSESFYGSLPDQPTTVASIVFGTILGNFRINRVFDYHAKVEDGRLKRMVKKYHDRFHKCLQPLLEARNKKRKEANQLGYQYFEPKWLTNSIHI